MLYKSISELGKVRANNHANKNNNARFVDCEDRSDQQVCQDVITGDTAANIVSIDYTYGGNTETIVFNTPIAASTATAKDIENELLKILDTDYVVEDRPYDYMPNYKEVNPAIAVTYDGTTLTIKHTGAGAISAVNMSSGTAPTVTRNCSLVNACVYKAMTEGALVSVIGDLATEALANSPYNFTGTPATDATTAAQLKTDLDAALATATSATIYDSAVGVGDSNFNIQIRASRNISLEFGNGEEFVTAICGEYFEA